MTPRIAERRGFTLVELLVVAAIMAALFGLVVTGARQGADRQVRQATQSLVSALMATQSRALGATEGAALILESGTAITDIGSITVANASMAPLITGSVMITGTPSTWARAVSLSPVNAEVDDLWHAYRIRFGGPAASSSGTFQPPSPWMSLAVPTTGGSAPCPGLASLRTANGQTPDNTIWPTSTAAMPFTAVRYPSLGDTVLSFPKLAAIDLRYSGVGEIPLEVWGGSNYLGGWSGLAAKGSIAIAFDAVGRLDALMQRVTEAASLRTVQPIRPSEPLYLLVTTREWITDHANEPLNSPDAAWVVVQPQTGRTTTAPNVPTLGVDATALRAARAKARAGTIGGK